MARKGKGENRKIEGGARTCGGVKIKGLMALDALNTWKEPHHTTREATEGCTRVEKQGHVVN